MKFLKTVVLVPVFVLLIAVGWCCLIVTGAERTVLSPAYYHGLFSKAGVAGHLHEKMLADLQWRFPEEVPEEARAVILEALARAFPAEWLQEQLLLAGDDILAFVKGKRPELTAVIDLRPGKELFAETLAEGLPELPAELLRFVGPPAGSAGSKVPEIILEKMLGEMPDQLHLAECFQEAPPEVRAGIEQFRYYRTYFLVLPYVALAVLLLFCILVAGRAGGLKWFGTAAIVSGATFLCALRLVHPGYVMLFLGIRVDPGNLAVLLAALQYTRTELSVVPIVYTLAGLAFLVGGLVVGETSRRPRRG